MTAAVRTLSPAERNRIAVAYGVEAVPERVTLCPPRAFSSDPAASMSWLEDRGAKVRIALRRRRFERARARADAAAGIDPDAARPSVAVQRAEAARIEAGRKPARAAARAPGSGRSRAPRCSIDADLARLADGTRTATAIAALLGVTAHRVRERARRLGLPIAATKGMGGTKAARARENERRVAELIGRGLSFRVVAAETGLAATSVCRIVKRLRARGAMPPRLVPETRVETVRRLTAEGLTAEAIGARLGLGIRQVQRIRRRAGLDGRDARRERTAAREAEIRALLAEGMDRAAIAHRVGIARKGVDTAIRRMQAEGSLQ